MEWTKTLSSGIAAIDRPNRELISMSSCLVTAIREQVCRYIIRCAINFLEDHVVGHFGKEEQFMQRCRYPDHLRHKAQHEGLKKAVEGLRKELDNPDPQKTCASYELSVEANQLIIDWGRDHMARADKDLGIFLREKMCVPC
jgi:methyl-accepting chemotaxis protein